MASFDDLLAALLADEPTAQSAVTRDVDRVFLKIVTKYRGFVPFNRLSDMDPEDFTENQSHVEILRWFRRYPSKFILFEKDDKRVAVIGVRVPSAKICPQYIGAGCKDDDCFMFHICRKFIGGYCRQGPQCPFDHHFQSKHNQQLLMKQNLEKFDEKDLLTIFEMSQLRVCDIYNKSNGVCHFDDRCTRLHVCENFVRGECTAPSCKLSHRVNASDHSQRLLRLYALDDKPQQDVLRNLLIIRRKQDVAVSSTASGAGVASSTATSKPSSLSELREMRLRKLLQMVANETDLSAETTVKTTCTNVESSSVHETSIRLDVDDEDEDIDSDDSDIQRVLPAATAATVRPVSPIAAAAGENIVWRIEVFGAWRSLSPTESMKIERQLRDGTKDTATTSILLQELGQKSTLVINFEKMTASLNYDLEIIEDIKVKRDNEAAAKRDNVAAADSVKRDSVTAADSVKRDNVAAADSLKRDNVAAADSVKGDSVAAADSLKRDNEAAGDSVQWLWYWKDDNDTWQQYSKQQCNQLEAAFQKKAPKVFLGKALVYQIKFSDMTQLNTTTGRIRQVRRRPQ